MLAESFRKKIANLNTLTRCVLKCGIRRFPWKQCRRKFLSVRSFHRKGHQVSWGGWGGKKEKKRARVTSRRACQAGASADERRQCDNRGAEMIRNKRRTLFIQVRIDLEARLIITLLFKCEVEISWCYRSNETSSVKRLYSTTDFLQFTKQKFEYYFHVNFLGHY